LPCLSIRKPTRPEPATVARHACPLVRCKTWVAPRFREHEMFQPTPRWLFQQSGRRRTVCRPPVSAGEDNPRRIPVLDPVFAPKAAAFGRCISTCLRLASAGAQPTRHEPRRASKGTAHLCAIIHFIFSRVCALTFDVAQSHLRRRTRLRFFALALPKSRIAPGN
jgi:hypothetical protein